MEAKKFMKQPIRVCPLQKNPYSFASIPDIDNVKLDQDAAYFYYTDNETVSGIEFDHIPDCKKRKKMLITPNSPRTHQSL